MDKEIIILLIQVLLASGLLAFIAKLTKDFIYRKKLTKFTQGLQNVGRIYDLMQQAMTETEASRVIILKNTDGGGIPKINIPVYATVLHEVYNSGVNPLKEEWQHRLLDGFYCQLLCELVLKEEVHICQDKVEGDLKGMYELHNHYCGVFFAIRETDNMFLYCCFLFEDEVDRHKEIIISNYVNKFKNLIDKSLNRE